MGFRQIELTCFPVFRTYDSWVKTRIRGLEARTPDGSNWVFVLNVLFCLDQGNVNLLIAA